MTQHDRSISDVQRIADEVAARYGVPVMPGAVQLCPPCTFSDPPDVAENRPGAAAVAAMQRRRNAWYRNTARAARLAAADAAARAGQAGCADGAQIAAMIDAQAMREAQLRALAADGVAVADIACRLAVSDAAVRAMAAKLRIALPKAARIAEKKPVAPKAAKPKPVAKPRPPRISPRQLQAQQRRAERMAQQAAATAERDRQIHDLVGAGLSRGAICAALVVSEKLLTAAMRRLGLPLAPTEARVAAEARNAALRAAVAEGLTAAQIGARMAMPMGSVRRQLSRMGLKAAAAPRGNKLTGTRGMTKSQMEALQSRRAAVMQGAMAGQSCAEIALGVGIDRRTCQRDLNALRAVGLPEGADRMTAFQPPQACRPKDAQRTAAIKAACAAGKPMAEIAQEFGVSRSAVSKAMCRVSGRRRTNVERRSCPDDADLLRLALPLIRQGLSLQTVRQRIKCGARRLERIVQAGGYTVAGHLDAPETQNGLGALA